MRANLVFRSAIVFAFALSIMSCGGGAGNVVKLQGAGASFPAPLYLKWFKNYSAAHANVQVDYQSVGSGSGVKSFMDHTVDFAASDAAMKPEDIADSLPPIVLNQPDLVNPVQANGNVL